MNKLTLRSLRSLNQNRLFSNSLRKMSTEYNVIIYDFPNSDRSKVRPQHVADIPETYQIQLDLLVQFTRTKQRQSLLEVLFI